jgi:hypothetical protein
VVGDLVSRLGQRKIARERGKVELGEFTRVEVDRADPDCPMLSRCRLQVDKRGIVQRALQLPFQAIRIFQGIPPRKRYHTAACKKVVAAHASKRALKFWVSARTKQCEWSHDGTGRNARDHVESRPRGPMLGISLWPFCPTGQEPRSVSAPGTAAGQHQNFRAAVRHSRLSRPSGGDRIVEGGIKGLVERPDGWQTAAAGARRRPSDAA